METQETALVYGPFISRAQAKAQGLKQYFTGKPCKHGHVASRWTNSGKCSECSRLADAKRYAEKGQAAEYKTENRARAKRWKAANPEKAKANACKYMKTRRERDPEFKRRHDLRTRRYRAAQKKTDIAYRLKCHLRTRLYQAVTAARAVKSARTLRLVGCSVSELKAHLQSLFAPGMSWDTYGEWHIDHIRPCASFDLTDPAQQRECFHYTNLQPLWAADNLAKSDTWEPSAA